MILYSIGCPQCHVLKHKLIAAGIAFEEIKDREIMLSKNLEDMPTLEVDGELYNFKEALDYITKVKAQEEINGH